MKTELDDRYLVLKLADIKEALDDLEIQDLNFAIRCITRYRESQGRSTCKQYAVVSESMKCYEQVVQLVLDELNDERRTC